MVLPLGNWDIGGNGFRGTLNINGVDNAGNLNASVVFESSELQQARLLGLIQSEDHVSFG